MHLSYKMWRVSESRVIDYTNDNYIKWQRIRSTISSLQWSIIITLAILRNYYYLTKKKLKIVDEVRCLIRKTVLNL